MSVWLMIVLAGLLTFAIRLSFIILLDRFRMPAWFRQSLGYVPVAVLSAIILPQTMSRNGALDFSLRNPQLWSMMLAVLVAWRSRNIVLTIGAGMAALLGFQALLRLI